VEFFCRFYFSLEEGEKALIPNLSFSYKKSLFTFFSHMYKPLELFLAFYFSFFILLANVSECEYI
jgi:hypothetical protein